MMYIYIHIYIYLTINGHRTIPGMQKMIQPGDLGASPETQWLLRLLRQGPMVACFSEETIDT